MLWLGIGFRLSICVWLGPLVLANPPEPTLNSTTNTSLKSEGVPMSTSTKPPVVLYHKDRLSDLKIIDALLKTYDRRATPTNKFGKPTQVGCELFIRSFGSISEKTMDYQVDLYLRQHWEDPRLNDPAITEALDLNDPKLVQAIWKPEVYFPNAKEGEFQYVTVPNVLLRIEPNGQILYMLRLKMKFSCMMELNKYPLDVQVCSMEIASFSKTTRELLLEWNKKNPVDLSSDLKMPQFTMESVITDVCDETSLIGNYSCLVARFKLSRSLGFHMVQSYIPTILIVVISWVSFWMDVDAVPGRTTLGVTTLLTVSSKSAGLNSETPQVSYVKAIDVWMGACTAFIFAALIEFTVVNYLWRRRKFANRPLADRINEKISKEHQKFELSQIEILSQDGMHRSDTANFSQNGVHQDHDRSETDANTWAEQVQTNRSETTVTVSRQPPKKEPKNLGIQIDAICRVMFPLNFVIFNFLYWAYYLNC